MANTTLRIHTALGQQQESGDSGPLLLANVQGIEGISMPFAYDVTMFQSLGSSDIDPRQMINTPVTIGMRGKTDEYTWRCGIFQTFEKDETNEQNWDDGNQTDYRVFRGRIVPVFKMLDYEVVYRVFEDMNALAIIAEVLETFPMIGGAGRYLSAASLNTGELPRIPYCVQFAESSFNFVSRLMAQFDIWYRFEHSQAGTKAATETMVLGNTPANFHRCARAEMDIVYTGPKVTDISGFQRSFQPARKRLWVSDFNMLKPNDIPRGDAGITETYDMMPNDTSTRFGREIFPATFGDPRASSVVMREQAKNRMEDEEQNVFSVTGQSKNPTFIAGEKFHVHSDKTLAGSNKIGVSQDNNYLITKVSFAAYENSYGHTVAQDIENWFDAPVRWVVNLFRDKNETKMLYLDAVSALASAGLSNYLQNYYNSILSKNTSASRDHSEPYIATGAALVSGALGGIVQAVIQVAVVSNTREIVARHADDFSNAFTAIPYDSSTYSLIPGPDGFKPRANGPHLAVVVGREGTGGKVDVYADALGRVRVRFPWQREVPLAQPGSSVDPLKSDRRTCWVPVSEGWSGRGFGTQFLPRIGQQVLVSFIDGDPDRPIITGRVYSADGGVTNLPFASNASASKPLNSVSDLPGTVSEDLRFSGIETRSMPRPRNDKGNPTGKIGFHLVRFDDTYDHEQLLIRSEARMDVTAKRNRFETTEGDRHVTVVQGKDADDKPFGGSDFTTVGGESHLHVGKDRYEAVDGNYQLTVNGDTLLDLKGDFKARVGGNLTLNASTIVIEAAEKITLRVGPSTIVLNHNAIIAKSVGMAPFRRLP